MSPVDHHTIQNGTGPAGGSPRDRWSGPTMLIALLGVMWIVQIVDEFALDDRLEGDGIRPRHLDGLLGIVWAPFLHAGFAHLIANTLPFLVLGGLVLVHGRARWLTVTIVVILLGGALTWLFGRSANHIGASGLVFGYFGYLIGSAFLRRNVTAVVTALAAIVVYGGIIVGFVPRSGISWEGHLFGAIAGLVAARLMTPKRPDRHGLEA